ncbi:MAG: hypothetical protein R3264_11855 [Anaerolineae bacterium]|nr:hypothetical protein [Anaerolineae bacterium]
MSFTTTDLKTAAHNLHGYLLKEHWTGQALVGPDPGIRFNARIGRFIKGYLNFLPWSDNLVYLQAQGYWIFNNWLLAELAGEDHYRHLALACSDYVLAAQQPDGYWPYPNPEWRGRVATVEGCFAALGLLESYARRGNDDYLEGAKKWYDYLLSGIGFRGQARAGMLAINYFAHQSGDGGGVPNNSTLVLWTLARLAELSRDDQVLATAASLIRWLKHTQLASGELPYAVGATPAKDRIHFLCYQYNAFEFMDLVHYWRITGDASVWPIMEPLAAYLAGGLTEAGAARYDCAHAQPEVIYYTLAMAQALSQATSLGLGDFSRLVERAYGRVLSQQRQDGGFEFYSRGNYGFLSDQRSYPRYLAMILHHLLREVQTRLARHESVAPAINHQKQLS